MSTTNWTLFATVVLLATAALLVLSRASARVISPGTEHGAKGSEGDRSDSVVPTGVALLANVALTHGLLAVGLVALVWYASVPIDSLGVRPVTVETVFVGLGVGVGLYLAGETATAVADRVGVEYDERLRESMAPEGPFEWAALLFVVLPLIAFAEELLFRGILIGSIGAGFDVPSWGLAIGSSVLFGAGHSAQGFVGVVVTAVLGLALAGAYLVTGSLVAVVVAHYTVNALEFVIREGVLAEGD